ncbi:DUF6069 family protein [Pseudonocardia thermophila]|uniref:DUF6069 family protein n=1 Tax=Pseudonocardia thermophila TaxID=1848 RepID=UPI00248E1F6B|nr:DUF6069 family protein [Pseudonocardia thermophila]
MAGYDDQTKRIGDGGWPPAGRPASTPQINVARLWSGGVATAVVAALIGLVGVLIVRVLLQTVPGAANAAEFNDSGAIFICSTAAVAALVATGLVHLLLLGTPRPLAYFGWIVGLLTAIAVVVPFLSSRQILTSVALAVIHLVIGIAIGSLVTGAAAAATRRPPVRSGYDQGWDDRRY